MKAKVLFCVLLVFVLLSVRVNTATPPISWDPGEIQLIMGRGDTKEVEVCFSSSVNLQNAYLWTVPALRPFVTISPGEFSAISPGTSIRTVLRFQIPSNAQVGMFEGTIHLRAGDRTYPQTLKIGIYVVDVTMIIGPEGGVISTRDGYASVSIPAGAVSEDALFTICPKEANVLGGHVYEFGPSDVVFGSPVMISLFFDPSQLTEGIGPENLFIAAVDDYIEILKDIRVDTSKYEVSGSASHFSNYAIGAYKSTGVRISDFYFDAEDFRLPIGDSRRLPNLPAGEDKGEELELLDCSTWTRYNYPKISFNLNGNADNRWYVAVAFNQLRYLNNCWAEPSEGANSLYSSKGYFHPGEDWNDLRCGPTDLGSPLHAVAEGIVLFSQSQRQRATVNANWVSSDFGNILVIGHKVNSGGIVASVYAHMVSPSEHAAGSRVTKGDVIGLLGGSGNVAPHLHFEITKDNNVLLNVDGQGNIRVLVVETELKVKGWYWPGTDQAFITANYNNPSMFIKNYVSEPREQYELVTQWALHGYDGNKVVSPAGIAIDSSGFVYVTDYYNSCIQKFTRTGSFIDEWARAGSGDGEFQRPWGIATDDFGYVYVVDCSNFRIQKFTSTGVFIKKWGTWGVDPGQFYYPLDIAIDNSGFLYITDQLGHCVHKYTTDGIFVSKWGTFGSGDGQFNTPVGIAVDNSGFVYVSDCGNHRIQKFHSNGTFVSKWGSWGYGDGEFRYPSALGVDSTCHVYVYNQVNGADFQKFTSTGTFVTKWEAPGGGCGKIFVDDYGYVFVANNPGVYVYRRH